MGGRGVKEADCRKCVYFVPRDQMNEEHWDVVAREWFWMPPKKIKGWCKAWSKPVTYYVGKCSKFRDVERCSLLRWLK